MFNLRITINHADNTTTDGLGCLGSWEAIVRSMTWVKDHYDTNIGPDLRATSFMFIVTVED